MVRYAAKSAQHVFACGDLRKLVARGRREANSKGRVRRGDQRRKGMIAHLFVWALLLACCVFARSSNEVYLNKYNTKGCSGMLFLLSLNSNLYTFICIIFTFTYLNFSSPPFTPPSSFLPFLLFPISTLPIY